MDEIFTLVVISLFAFIVGSIQGVGMGRVQVASGQVVCELIEGKNKETEWECN